MSIAEMVVEVVGEGDGELRAFGNGCHDVRMEDRRSRDG